MPSVLIGETRDNHSCTFSFQDGKINVSQSRSYRVQTDNPFISDEAVALTPGLPIPGVTLTSSGAVCKSLQAYRDPSNAYWWNVVVQFNNDKPSQQNDPQKPDSADPTTWIPIWRYNLEYIREPDITADNETIKNTNGRPFSEQRTKETPIYVAKFSQYMPASIKPFSPTFGNGANLSDFASKTNSTVYRDAAIETLLCILDAAEYGTYNGYDACRLDITVKYKPTKWIETYWARDTWAIQGGKLLPILDEQGQQIEWWLNSTGGLAGNPVGATGPTIPTISQIGKVNLRRYEKVDFTTLFRSL
jgi:hypothetical protein